MTRQRDADNASQHQQPSNDGSGHEAKSVRRLSRRLEVIGLFRELEAVSAEMAARPAR